MSQIIVSEISFFQDGEVVIRDLEDNESDMGNMFLTSSLLMEHISGLFNVGGERINYLVIDYEDDKINKCHALFDSDAWDVEELDIKFSSVSLRVLRDIYDKDLKRHEEELAYCKREVNDALRARVNASNVRDFEEFTQLVHDLEYEVYEQQELRKAVYDRFSRLLDTNVSEDDYTSNHKSYLLLSINE